jgi:hypothetical protein
VFLTHSFLFSEERLNLDEETFLFLAQSIQLGLDTLALPLYTLFPLMALLTFLILSLKSRLQMVKLLLPVSLSLKKGMLVKG